jgi:hypothetical protein
MNTTNTIITQAIGLGFDFEQFTDDTTVKEITQSLLDFFNENSELLPRIEDACEVTSNSRGQTVSYGDYVSSGEIVDFLAHLTDAPETKVFHSNFVMEEDGIMKNMNLYYLVGETEYNVPDGFYFDKKSKSHVSMPVDDRPELDLR